MQAVMTMTPSAAARTGANYDESALVPRSGPVVLRFARQLECELADGAEMHRQVFVQAVSLEQLLRDPHDRRGRGAEAEVATARIGHPHSHAHAIATGNGSTRPFLVRVRPTRPPRAPRPLRTWLPSASASGQ